MARVNSTKKRGRKISRINQMSFIIAESLVFSQQQQTPEANLNQSYHASQNVI